MPGEIRVFVNGVPRTLPAGTRVRDALADATPDLLPACERGEALVTDACGLPLPLDAPLSAGCILRARRSSRRSPDPARDVPA